MFEYASVIWPSDAAAADLTEALNTLGADNWEAVGMVARATEVLMPGMGSGDAVSEIVVLLKRTTT